MLDDDIEATCVVDEDVTDALDSDVLLVLVMLDVENEDVDRDLLLLEDREASAVELVEVLDGLMLLALDVLVLDVETEDSDEVEVVEVLELDFAPRVLDVLVDELVERLELAVELVLIELVVEVLWLLRLE